MTATASVHQEGPAFPEDVVREWRRDPATYDGGSIELLINTGMLGTVSIQLDPRFTELLKGRSFGPPTMPITSPMGYLPEGDPEPDALDRFTITMASICEGVAVLAARAAMQDQGEEPGDDNPLDMLDYLAGAIDSLLGPDPTSGSTQRGNGADGIWIGQSISRRLHVGGR